MKRHIFIILYILFPIMAFAQMRITGTVTDTNGEPLTDAIIQIRSNATNKMLHYAKTDSKGAFSIETTAESYMEVSMFGFKKQRINNLTDKKPLRIVMQDETVVLNEVTVKANKVRENGDTLTYNVAAYADGNDRSIGDVLARIPGFEVNKQNGQIMYDGKAINKFYIEGVDMLGSKYGVATNSLPQVDVGSVQVMRNHQPIRVLEDFTFTDEAAVNLRMKEGAKNRWVTSFNCGGGVSRHTGLWNFEGFGLRLKPEYQTMITYKTNNIGQDISKETVNNLNGSDGYIRLSPPSTPNLAESRTLFNRSHAVTLNTLKRFNESSQMNVQLIYNNIRRTADGERRTEYFVPEENRIIDNRKEYKQRGDELFALVKYEHNSERSYLKNSLSGDFAWIRQWLNEIGTNSHSQFARKPKYEIEDNLYIISRCGNRLLSLNSINHIISRPQSLTVDSLYQHISSQRYSTNTYATGGLILGRFSLSLTAGVSAVHNHLESNLTGLSDSLGLQTDDSRFTFTNLYVMPSIIYKTPDINMEFSPRTAYLYEKYSHDNGHHQMLFSPDLTVRWNVTPRMVLSLAGSSSLSSLNANRFYRSLILQDFQYINRGYAGYLHGHDQSIRGSIKYSNALKAILSYLTFARTFSTSPYTQTRRFVGDYIILSAVEQESKSDSWQANLIVRKGINLWNGHINIRATYSDNDASMLQNGEITDYNNQGINIHTQLDFSFWKDMRLRYGFAFSQNRMKIQSMDYSQTTDGWKQNLSVIIPIDPFSIDVRGEYYRNEITSGNYKNFFLADIKAGYKTKHLDLSLSLNNLLNHDRYSYVITSDLSSSTSTNHIRGREVLISLYYKP